MCKKLICLMSLVLLLGLAGSALAVIESTYTIGATQYGTVCPADDPGFCSAVSIMYIDVKWGSPCTGPTGLVGWTRNVIPDLSLLEVPQTIIKAELQYNVLTVQGYTLARPFLTRSSDDSWTAATIASSWSVTADQITGSGGAGWYTIDITSWYGAGKESLTGGEDLTIRYTMNPDPGGYVRMHGSYTSVILTTVPEPMTIALLGLGGLALLRKRR